jgi:WD40 repeat protein
MQIDKEENEYGFGDNIDLSPDGKTLISTVEYFQAEDKSVSALLDSESFKLLKILPDYLYAPTFNVTGELIGGYTSRGDVPYTYYIGLYDMRDKSFQKLGANRGIQYAGHSIKFTKDNKYIIATRDLEGYSVWDIVTKKPLYEAPYQTGGQTFCISDDSKLFCRLTGFSVIMWKFKDPLLNTIDDALPSKSIHLFPNPTQSLLTIQLPSIQQHGKGYCSISDIQGNKVIEKEIMQTELAASSYSLNIAHLPNGRYNCHIVIGSSEYFAHFLINR